MAKNKSEAPAFLEIVFEFRNKEYGAYRLRKKHDRNLIIGILVGAIIMSTATIVPYLNAKASAHERVEREEIAVEITMDELQQPNEDFAPPPPPPPPPADAVQQARYVPPVIVDSVRPEDEMVFMTVDEIREEIVDREVTEEIVVVATTTQVEVEDVEEMAPFISVEEMPSFPGGEAALLKFISENVVYPDRAKENNIQGRVFVRFCVTARGTVNQASVVRGVDPELDAAALKVVSLLPAFSPGKQGGRAVPVWYNLPILFQLQ